MSGKHENHGSNGDIFARWEEDQLSPVEKSTTLRKTPSPRSDFDRRSALFRTSSDTRVLRNSSILLKGLRQQAGSVRFARTDLDPIQQQSNSSLDIENSKTKEEDSVNIAETTQNTENRKKFFTRQASNRGLPTVPTRLWSEQQQEEEEKGQGKVKTTHPPIHLTLQRQDSAKNNYNHLITPEFGTKRSHLRGFRTKSENSFNVRYLVGANPLTAVVTPSATTIPSSTSASSLNQSGIFQRVFGSEADNQSTVSSNRSVMTTNSTSMPRNQDDGVSTPCRSIATPPELHRACADPSVDPSYLMSLLDADPSLASLAAGRNGEVPLQILSRNYRLFKGHSPIPTVHGRSVDIENGTGSFSPLTSSIVTGSLPTVKDAVEIEDANNEVQYNNSNESSLDNNKKKGTVTLLHFVNVLLEANPMAITVKDERGMIPFVPVIRSWVDENRPILRLEQNEVGNNQGSRSRQPIVAPPLVEWAFLVLSSVRKYDERCNVPTHEMAAHVSAPELLATIIAIDDVDTRHRIFAYPIVRLAIIAGSSTQYIGGTNKQKLAIHYIAENAIRLSSNLREVENLVFELVSSHPVGATVSYYPDGSIPFTSPILDWIDREKSSGNQQSSISGGLDGNNADAHTHVSALTNEDFAVPTVVDWSLCMLTSILHLLEKSNFVHNEQQYNIGNGRNGNGSNSHSNQSGGSNGASSVDDGGVNPLSQDLIIGVASIPYLMKTVLLIQNSAMRDHIMSYPILRRVMFAQESIDQWLVSMFIHYDGRLVDTAIHYLMLLSTMTAQEYYVLPASNQHLLSAGHIQHFHNQRNAVFRAIGRLNGFLSIVMSHPSRHGPSLHHHARSMESIGGGGVNTHFSQMDVFATHSPLVKAVLDEVVQTPFSMLIIMMDATFLIFMVIGLRIYINCIQHGCSRRILVPFYYATLFCSTYLLMRELLLALFVHASYGRRHLFLKHFADPWKLADLVSVILVVVGILMAEANRTPYDLEPQQINHSEFPGIYWVLSMATGLCYVKVISYLRKMNVTMALLLASLTTVFTDLCHIFLLLIIIATGFAQVLYTIIPMHLDCDKNVDMCDSRQSYLQTFSLLVGYLDFDVDREVFFSKSPILTFLFVVYSFVVVVLVMNFLIAKIIDSYEKSTVEAFVAWDAFAKARLEFISQIVSLERVFQHGYKFRSGCFSYDRILFISAFVILAILEIAILAFWEGSWESLVWGIVGINFGLAFVIAILFVLSFESMHSQQSTKNSVRARPPSRLTYWLTLPIRVGESNPRRLVTNLNNSAITGDRLQKSLIWNGKMNFLRDEIDHMVTDSEIRLIGDINASQEMMLKILNKEMTATEQRLRGFIREEVAKLRKI